VACAFIRGWGFGVGVLGVFFGEDRFKRERRDVLKCITILGAMKRSFDDARRELPDAEILQVMVRDSLDDAERKAKKAKLVRSLIDNPIYEPLFEERWGDLVRRGRLPTLYYNHPSVTKETDSHPLRDIWSVILNFQHRLSLKERWLQGKIQIFTLFPVDAFLCNEEQSMLVRRFHYNKGESIGVFAQWHQFLREMKDLKEYNNWKIDTMARCQYWSTAGGKMHDWESLQMA